MAGRYDRNPFEEGDVNPFAGGSVPPASNSRMPPLPHEPGFYNDRDSTADIPLDSTKDMKKKERELQAKEAEINKRERELKRREEAASRAGIVIEEKNWPPFFPIIHHDISNEIPIHLQRMQYLAFSSLLVLIAFPFQIHILFCIWSAVAPPFPFKGKSLAGILPAIDVIGNNAIVGAKPIGNTLVSVSKAAPTLPCILSHVVPSEYIFLALMSPLSWPQVYMYFRGSGKAAEMKRDAARGVMRNAF
ncbi:hypothetical protein ABZP36_017303 [Zizania latifolia]